MQMLLKLVVLLVAGYALFLGSFFAAMYQPPETFAAIVAKMPQYLSPAIPFRRMWMVARKGRLELGDPAPAFELASYDKQSTVRLAELNQGRPVVLVFGSYT